MVLQESHIDPSLQDLPKVSQYIAVVLQKYALPLLVGSSLYTTPLYHDTPPIRIVMLLLKYWGQGWLEHPQAT